MKKVIERLAIFIIIINNLFYLTRPLYLMDAPIVQPCYDAIGYCLYLMIPFLYTHRQVFNLKDGTKENRIFHSPLINQAPFPTPHPTEPLSRDNYNGFVCHGEILLKQQRIYKLRHLLISLLGAYFSHSNIMLRTSLILLIRVYRHSWPLEPWKTLFTRFLCFRKFQLLCFSLWFTHFWVIFLDFIYSYLSTDTLDTHCTWLTTRLPPNNQFVKFDSSSFFYRAVQAADCHLVVKTSPADSVVRIVEFVIPELNRLLGQWCVIVLEIAEDLDIATRYRPGKRKPHHYFTSWPQKTNSGSRYWTFIRRWAIGSP